MYAWRQTEISFFLHFLNRQARSPPSFWRPIDDLLLRRYLRSARAKDFALNTDLKYTSMCFAINVIICSDGCWRARFSHLVTVLFDRWRSRRQVMKQYLLFVQKLGRFNMSFVNKKWAKIMTFCPCMGRFGNQLGQLLKTFRFFVIFFCKRTGSQLRTDHVTSMLHKSKEIKTTLLLPSFISYEESPLVFIPFEDVFQVRIESLP